MRRRGWLSPWLCCSCGYSLSLFVFVIATLTGLVEPVTGFMGAYAVSLSQSLLPWGMTFAAGAMIYVISHEIIPERTSTDFRTKRPPASPPVSRS